MEWLVLFFFLPFVLTLMFFNWLEEKFISFKNKEKLEEGEAMLHEKKYAQAKAFFSEKLKRFPKSAKAYLLRTKANLFLENYYSALYDIEQSISFDNTVAEAYVLKGKILYKLDEFDKAFLEFDKADWHYRSENPIALRWRGMARFQIGQTDNAIEDFRRAVELGDEDAEYILRTQFEYIKR
ncbi:tetratricopeptide repeat protein [Flectobacillus major]|jgi:tetratricopeptide (TPR) repeat protein|uniref:tetratricopeptide repeat protein n=1 Tax=Flectobacillus major TaxID=103 RepID=UPI0004012C97|nr:tetratricopeptide repeat protein [Flectobacillus major]